MKRILFIIFATICGVLSSSAQQYTGLNGGIHIPTADMDTVGTARIGAHYLNKEFLPDRFVSQGHKYPTYDFYLSLTPFSWVEIGYTMTLLKGKDNNGNYGYKHKDRYFSIKIRPLTEGKYWPAVAIGGNDFITSSWHLSQGNDYFRNYFIALTKHFRPGGHDIGVSVDYRWFTRASTKKWRGVVAGVEYRPAFYKPLRLMVEWTGNEVNVGVDCLLFHHFLVQVSAVNGKYPQAGLCYMVNLL